MENMIIYNVKQQANLPTGTYTHSGASGDDNGTIGIYLYFNPNGTWQLQHINGLSPNTTPYSGTWESRSPSTPANYEIRFVVSSATISGNSVANNDDAHVRYGGTGITTVDPTPDGFDTGWSAFTQQRYMAVTSYNNFGISVVCTMNFTVYIRDTAPTFNTISSSITIQSTGT